MHRKTVVDYVKRERMKRKLIEYAELSKKQRKMVKKDKKALKSIESCLEENKALKEANSALKEENERLRREVRELRASVMYNETDYDVYDGLHSNREQGFI